MNDYISKPIDERQLYNKIIELLKKPASIHSSEKKKSENMQALLPPFSSLKCIDLTYLTTRTKAKPKLMMEMIALYLEQTPPLIHHMKQCLFDKDWDSLHAAVHKMIPSFSIVGINKDFENMAKNIQEYTGTLNHLGEIPGLVVQLENICSQACRELEEEYNLIINNNK